MRSAPHAENVPNILAISSRDRFYKQQKLRQRRTDPSLEQQKGMVIIMDYLEIANSLPMWIACGLCVLLTIIQAAVFTLRAKKACPKVGISDTEFKEMIGVAANSSIGPSVVILVGMISLMVAMGSPVAWYRLSFIGSVTHELTGATFGAEAVGVTLGGEDMNALAFANGVWVMSLVAIPWILFTALFTPQMSKIRSKMAGGDATLIPVVSAAAIVGAAAYLCMSRVLRFDSQTVASLVGFITMFILVKVNNKFKKKWISEWGFTIAMFVGMIASVLF